MQELMSLKNQRGALPVSSSEELSQRISLQKLANELELAQQDFADKKDGRALTRDIATTALSKIGESIATAYIQSQQIAASQSALDVASQSGLTPPPVAPVAVSTAVEPVRAETVKEIPKAIESATAPAQQGAGESYRVKGTPTENGSLSIPCPVCGQIMTAKPGDMSVACEMCGSSFTAGAPPAEERQEHREDYHEERHEEIPSVYEYAGDEMQTPETPETRPEERTEAPVRKPNVIL